MIAKIYIDEDISPILAQILRKGGIDAVSAHEINLIGKSDEEHIDYAMQNDRVFVTCNVEHFPNLSKEKNHKGIILARQVPLAGYSALANGIIDKITSIENWAGIVVWATLK